MCVFVEVCVYMCVLMGRVVESPGFTEVHVEAAFSSGNRSSILNQEYIVVIHKINAFKLWY